MIKINSFPKTKLLQEEIYLFCQAICQKIKEADPDKLYIKQEYFFLEGTVNTMEISLYKLPVGVYNKQRSNMQYNIENFMTRLFTYIKSFVTKNDPDKIAAKKELDAIITQYKALGRKPFEKLVESNIHLAEIIHDESHAQAVSLLELDEYIKTLDNLNTSALNLLEKKLKANGLIRRIRKANIVRRELEGNYNKIVTRLNQLAMTYETDLYKPLFDWWNTYTDNLRIQIDSRKRTPSDVPIDDNIFTTNN